MNKTDNLAHFTGEFFVPGQSGERIEADHMERYFFACNYVKDKTVLDIACGFGYASPLMMEAEAATYEGVDINEQLVDNANHIYGADKIKYYKGDICTYCPGRLFNVITCFETIEHVSNYHGALLNIYNLLEPNGMLIISSPNRPITSTNANSLEDKPSNCFHVQEFTIEELKYELLSVGLSVDENDVFGQRLSSLNIRNKHLNHIYRLLFGDASVKSPPMVSKIGNKIPRYFIILAYKPST